MATFAKFSGLTCNLRKRRVGEDRGRARGWRASAHVRWVSECENRDDRST